MKSRRGASLASSAIGVVGLALVGFAGYNALTGGCGACSTDKSATQTAVVSEEKASCCPIEAGTVATGCNESQVVAIESAVAGECSAHKIPCTGELATTVETSVATPAAQSKCCKGKPGCEGECSGQTCDDKNAGCGGCEGEKTSEGELIATSGNGG